MSCSVNSRSSPASSMFRNTYCSLTVYAELHEIKLTFSRYNICKDKEQPCDNSGLDNEQSRFFTLSNAKLFSKYYVDIGQKVEQ